MYICVVLNPGIVEKMYVYPTLNPIVEKMCDQCYSSNLPASVYLYPTMSAS